MKQGDKVIFHGDSVLGIDLNGKIGILLRNTENSAQVEYEINPEIYRVLPTGFRSERCYSRSGKIYIKLLLNYKNLKLVLPMKEEDLNKIKELKGKLNRSPVEEFILFNLESIGIN